MQQQTGPLGATVLGIDVRDDRAAAADFVRDRGLTYPSIFDPPGRSLAQLGGVPRNVVPLTVVLDRQHRVAAVYLRRVRVAELIPLVQRLAAEPPTPDPPPLRTRASGTSPRDGCCVGRRAASSAHYEL